MRAYNAKYGIIVVDVCTPNGFLQNARLVYQADTTTRDYHGQMNNENFKKWITEKLIPNLPPNSVIIMDNAPYHSVLQEKVPSKSAVKRDMLNWLGKKNIQHDPNMRKYELFDLIQKYKPVEKSTLLTLF